VTDEEIEQHAVEHAVAHSRDPKTHRWLQITRVGQLVGLAILAVLVALLFIRQESRDDDARDLAEHVQAECDSGAFTGSICDKAKVVEKNVEADPVVPPVVIAGDDGRDGKDGQDGKPGRNGQDGKPGQDGKDGADAVAVDGADGANGLSAYELAVGTGFQGTIGEWLASLKGEKGDTVEGPRGQSAYPFTFAFVVPENPPIWPSTTYECVMTKPDVVEQCSEKPTGDTGEDSDPSS
jgi:hypothetical protein